MASSKVSPGKLRLIACITIGLVSVIIISSVIISRARNKPWISTEGQGVGDDTPMADEDESAVYSPDPPVFNPGTTPESADKIGCDSTDFLTGEHGITGSLSTMSKRIFGGVAVKEASKYPFLFAPKDTTSYSRENKYIIPCQGTLVSPEFILTAAHCARDDAWGGKLFVSSVYPPKGGYLGTINYHTNKKLMFTDSFSEVVSWSHYWMHPQHNSNLDFDVALLQLVAPATKTQPVTLDSNEIRGAENAIPDKTKFTAIGYGRTETGSTSSDLLEVDLLYRNNEMCSRRYGNAIEITEEMVCAGAEAGKDSCSGDSGGPLLANTGSGYAKNMVQVGVTSFGSTCGSSSIPGVYARVARFRPWIDQLICWNSNFDLPSFCTPEMRRWDLRAQVQRKSGLVEEEGAIFDVEAKDCVTVRSFELPLADDAGALHSYKIFTKTGTASGSQHNRNKWFVMCEGNVRALGLENPTRIPKEECLPIKIDRGDRQAFYILVENAVLINKESSIGGNYEAKIAETPELKLMLGEGVLSKNAQILKNHLFLGTINYSVADCPIPDTLSPTVSPTRKPITTVSFSEALKDITSTNRPTSQPTQIPTQRPTTKSPTKNPTQKPSPPPTVESSKKLYSTDFAKADSSFMGVIFSVKAQQNPIQINTFGIHLRYWEKVFDIKVYTMAGFYSGAESDKSAWTLVCDGLILGEGYKRVSTISSNFCNPLVLAAREHRSFYIYIENKNVDDAVMYTKDKAEQEGKAESFDDNLIIYKGAGVSGEFDSNIIVRTRIFNGVIDYNVLPPDTILTSPPTKLPTKRPTRAPTLTPTTQQALPGSIPNLKTLETRIDGKASVEGAIFVLQAAADIKIHSFSIKTLEPGFVWVKIYSKEGNAFLGRPANLMENWRLMCEEYLEIETSNQLSWVSDCWPSGASIGFEESRSFYITAENKLLFSSRNGKSIKYKNDDLALIQSVGKEGGFEEEERKLKRGFKAREDIRLHLDGVKRNYLWNGRVHYVVQ